MNILFTSVAISQLKCLDYAFFVEKKSKNGVHALWWAGLTQYKSMVGRLDNSGAGPSEYSFEKNDRRNSGGTLRQEFNLIDI